LTLAVPMGCTWCAGGALTNLSYKLRLNNFFSALGGAGAPNAPLATTTLVAYVLNHPMSAVHIIRSSTFLRVQHSFRTKILRKRILRIKWSF